MKYHNIQYVYNELDIKTRICKATNNKLCEEQHQTNYFSLKYDAETHFRKIDTKCESFSPETRTIFKVKQKSITLFNVTAVENEPAVEIELTVLIETAVKIEPAVLEWVIIGLLSMQFSL